MTTEEIARVRQLLASAQRGLDHLEAGTYTGSETEHRDLLTAILEDAARKVQVQP